MGWGSGALQVGLLPPLVIDRGDTYGASGSPKRPPGGLHRCPPSVSGPRKGRRRIPTVPVGYTIVYNRRWPKRLAGMQKVSSSDQKRVRSVKTGSSFVLPILPNDPKNRIGASAKAVFGPSRREKRPFLPSGIHYSVAQSFCIKSYNRGLCSRRLEPHSRNIRGPVLAGQQDFSALPPADRVHWVHDRLCGRAEAATADGATLRAMVMELLSSAVLAEVGRTDL